MTGLLTLKTQASHTGLKLSYTYLTAIEGNVIFQNNNSLRFGSDNWDYSTWAGLKYNHSSKYIYLGLADGSIFEANSAQSGGSILTPGISNIFVGNNTTNKVWHAGNDGSGSGLDADLLDGKHSQSFRYMSIYDPSSSGMLVKTDIASSSNAMFSVHICGNAYQSGSRPIDSRLEFYSYNDSNSILNYNLQNNGYPISSIKIFVYNNYVYIWLPYVAKFQSYSIYANVTNDYKDYNHVVSISSGAVPSGATRLVTVTPKNVALTTSNVASATQLQTARTINGTAFNGTSNIVTSYWGTARTLSLTGNATGSVSMNGSANVSMSVNVNYATSAGNADTLDSLHASAFARRDQNPAVDLNTVNGHGIMTNGLNANATTARHYPIQEAGTLFYGTAAYSSANQIYGTFSSNRWFFRGGGGSTTTKTAWKEMAFLTSNVASATKLQTARTIWGQSFDGTAPVSGNMTGVGSITMSGALSVTNSGYADVIVTNSASGASCRLRAATTGNAGLANEAATAWIIGSDGTNTFALTGNFGIGLTNPSYRLHVSGSIAATSYIYIGTGWFQNNTSGNGLYNSAVDARWYANGSGWISDKKINATAGLGVSGTTTLGGAVQVPYTVGSWISMATRTNLIYSTTNNSQSSAHALFRVKANNGNALCFGGLGNELGFYAFTAANISSGTNAVWNNTYWDMTNWKLTHRGALAVAGAVTFSSTLAVTGAITGSSTIYGKTGVYSDGYVSAKGANSSSDIRLKNILCHIRPSIEAFAQAPLFRFAWKSNPDMVEIGSSAQYWRNVLPDTVKERDGWLEMGYGNIALAGVITIARDFETLEQRVGRLEKENKRLQKRIKELERRTRE